MPFWEKDPPNLDDQPPINAPFWDKEPPSQQPEQPGPKKNWADLGGVAGQEFNYIFGAPENDFLAVGKTPKGEAYYGEGIAGWARKTWAKISDPSRHSDGLDYNTQENIDKAAMGVADQWAKDNPGIADWKDFVYSTTRWASLDKARIDQGGLVPTVLENVNAVVTGGVDAAIGGVFQAPSAVTKAGITAGDTLEDVANETGAPALPRTNTGVDWIDKASAVAQEISPSVQSWNLLRYAGSELKKGNIGGALVSTILAPIALSSGPFSKAVAGLGFALSADARQQELIRRDQVGANAIFTQMFDPLVKAEVAREIAAGTPPTFIEEKYANPWIEAAGGILTDPLTYIGGGIGSTAQKTKFLTDAQDVTKVLPEIADLAKVGLQSGHSGIQAMEYLKNATGAIDKAISGKFSDLTKLVNVNNFQRLTSAGKQFMLNRQLGSFERFLIGQFKDPEEAVDIFQTMARYATAGSETDKAQYLTKLMASPAGKAALSGPGVTWMGFARNLLETTDEVTGKVKHLPVEDFIDDILGKGKVGETAAEQTMNMAKYAGEKMEKLTAKLFPSVSDMENAAKLVREGGKVTEETKRLAGMLDDVPGYVRSLNATLGRNSVVGNVYNKFNSFFSAVYMGASPAFAVRNVLSNSTGILADQGVRVAADVTGSAFKSFFDKGATYGRYLKGIGDMLGGEASIPADLQDLASFAKEVGSNFGSLAWSNNAEKTTRAAIYYHSMAEVMDNFLTHGGLPPINTLTDAGMTPIQANAYMALMKKNMGNAEKTALGFKELMARTGNTIPEWKMVEPPQRLLKSLQSFGLDRQILDDIRFGEHATPDTIQAGIQRFRQSLQDMADRALREPVFPTDGSPEAAIAELGQDIGKGIKNGDELSQAYTTGAGVFQSAREAAYSAADKVFQDIVAQSRQAGLPLPPQYDTAMQMLNAAKKEMLGPEIAGGINAWKSLAADVVKRVKAGAITSEQALAELGKKLPGEFQIDMARYTADIPEGASFGDALYRNIQPSVMADWWQHFGEHQYKTVSNAIAMVTGDPKAADTVLADARQHMRDSMEIFDGIKNFKAAGAGASELTPLQQAQGAVNDIFKAAQDAGFSRNKDVLLKGINKDARDLGKVEYKMLRDVPPEEIVASIKKHGGPDLAGVVQPGSGGKFQVGTTILADAHGGAQHTLTGAINKQLPGLLEDLGKYEQQVLSKFNNIGEAGQALTPEAERAIEQFNQIVSERLITARQTAIELGRQKADFAIHAYGDKTYLDTALSFIMPYHYWQGRTYQKWMQRMVYRPDIVAAYGKYRHALETQHAGLPEWWKYNINSNELLGIDSDNPMFFNLEATLNPINGITGVDFNDSKKRVDWLTRSVDDVGKFGPSLFTPLQWIVAASMYAKGEKDAAMRWTGRLIPQTQNLKQVINLAGVQAPQVGDYGKYGEYDPFVNLFQGGLDAYERPRVGRALGEMQDQQIEAIYADPNMTPQQKQAQISTLQAQFISTSNDQKGPMWDKAVQLSQSARAPGALSSYILGVGFKNRNPHDIELDRMYSEYYQLMAASSNIAPDKFRSAMSYLQQKYPWMDTVLISRKADDDRLTAYAYNVLGRMGPGQSGDFLKKAGITSDMIGRFYDTKGTFKNWTEQDIQRFNAGIADLGTLLAMPDAATKQEWDAVRAQYGFMQDEMKRKFGDDIMDKIDLYFNKTGDDQKRYIQLHTELQGAFDFKASAYSSHPLLSKYYGGIENLTKYYKSQMYAALDAKFGEDIQQKFDEYGELSLSDKSAASAFWRAHPELAGYSKEKETWNEYILKRSVEVGAKLPDGPTVAIRNDFEPSSPVQEDLLSAAQGQQQPTWDELKTVLGSPSLERLVLDYWVNGEDLSDKAEKQLEYAASKNGFDGGYELLQAIGLSLQRQYQP